MSTPLPPDTPSSHLWRPPPPPPPINNHAAVAGLTIASGIFFFVLLCVRTLYRQNRDRAAAHAVGDATALADRPRAPPPPPPEPWDNDEQLLRPRGDGDNDGRRSRRVSTTAAGLPSFTYSRSVMHNATGGAASGDEATTCSVCLGVFQAGETVRLLPVCMHLYHVECIDPWLDMHSTCPICRSGTDPTTEGRLHSPV